MRWMPGFRVRVSGFGFRGEGGSRFRRARARQRVSEQASERASERERERGRAKAKAKEKQGEREPLRGRAFCAVAGVHTHLSQRVHIFGGRKQDPPLSPAQERIPRRRVVRISVHHSARARAAYYEKGVFRENVGADLRRHRVAVGVKEGRRRKILEQLCSCFAEVVVEGVPVRARGLRTCLRVRACVRALVRVLVRA